ncbi:APC family permease [Sphingomonas xanthus]|uniref:Arginine/agmatine antiporter n=1 Tax=Sphingomonas xanthus TaxID=2594473 RepID=A0A516IPX5_9SPHN|nr:amino acid permease [Sphingomonas xanthus]QDP18937.1 amino acid permease [Sphingomonas xanthus]
MVSVTDNEIIEPSGERLKAPPPPPPSKRLGKAMSMAMVVGTIIGSGIYLLPATTAPFGLNLVIAFAVVTIGTLALAYTMSRLSATLPGGPYSYVAASFGDTAAFMTMWSYMISLWAAIAAVSIAAAGALGHVVLAIGSGPGLVAFSIAAIAVLTLVNWNGARSAGVLQVIATLLKIVPLVLVVVLVLVQVSSGSPVEPLADTPLNFKAVVAAGALMLFAFTGFETAAIAANVTDNSQDAVPAATFRGTIYVAVIYLLATLSVLWLLPSAIAAQSAAPFANAIAPTLGALAGGLVAVIAAVSAIGTGNACVLSAVETGRAIANAGDLPPAFARTNANGVATLTLLVSAVLSGLLVLASVSDSFIEVFTFVALVSAVAALFLYLVCAAAAWKLKVAPAVVALLGILYSLGMFVGAGLEATLWGFGLMVAGLPIRWLSRRSTSRAAAGGRAVLGE